MGMTEELITKALETGFDAAGPLDCSTIILRPEVRQACETNKCRRYGESWSCPPGCGSLDECAERIPVPRASLCRRWKLEDDWRRCRAEQLMREGAHYPGVAKAYSGAFHRDRDCSNCDTHLSGYPRRIRDKFAHEAYGMMVRDVCKGTG